MFAQILSVLLLTVAQSPELPSGLAINNIPRQVSYSNKVEGLELPVDQTLQGDEGFVFINAKCAGKVKWLVVSQDPKVKYIINETDNSLIVSVPAKGDIMIFCVGNVKGELTEFAKTLLTVSKKVDPNDDVKPKPNDDVKPKPNDDDVKPKPKPINGILHVTFIQNFDKSTADAARVINSIALRNLIEAKKGKIRVLDVSDPMVKQKKIDEVMAKIGGDNLLLIQDDGGHVLYSGVIPKTDKEAIDTINKILGGN